ncbi:MAG: CdaR family protein [Ruminococcus sp.]|nr:CdaR family protein [Ruminococcus sp.]
MKFLKGFREKYMQSNLALAILSVIIAIFVWLIISLTQYPDSQKTIEHIPLSRDIKGSVAESNGLSIISSDVEEVTVELLGSKLQVGNLNSENLEAYLDADSVTGVGTRTLTIKIRGASNINYEIKSVKPSTATVLFDKMDTREFKVEPQITNVSVVDGKAVDQNDITCDPSVVRITGPSSQLDKISKCYAVSNKELSLDSTYLVSADELQLYTEDNALIDQSSLKFSETHFDITVPVVTQKEVELFVSIIDAPENFDTSIIKFSLSADSVLLACNNSQTEIPDRLDIGKVSLSELKQGFSKMFLLSSRLEGTELENVSNLEAVTVTFNEDDFAQKPLVLDKSRINLSNEPDKSNYTYEVKTPRMEITLMGPADVLEDITPEDIVVDIDLLNANITSDTFSWNAKFSCKNDKVWVATNSKVTVMREKT